MNRKGTTSKGSPPRGGLLFVLAPNTSSPITLALTEDEITVLEKVLTVRDFFATHISSLPAIPRL